MKAHRLRHPQTLSRGQRQILAVVSVMAMEPEIFILDEPTTGLDDRSWHKLFSLLYDYADRGGTIVFSTHNERASALAGPQNNSCTKVGSSTMKYLDKETFIHRLDPRTKIHPGTDGCDSYCCSEEADWDCSCFFCCSDSLWNFASGATHRSGNDYYHGHRPIFYHGVTGILLRP